MPDNLTKLSIRLQARAGETELSHKATAGKVGAEQLSYLMS